MSTMEDRSLISAILAALPDKPDIPRPDRRDQKKRAEMYAMKNRETLRKHLDSLDIAAERVAARVVLVVKESKSSVPGSWG